MITKNKDHNDRGGRYFLSDTECLFLTSDGKVRFGNLQRGFEWESSSLSEPQISPLYRVEKYEGELPTKCAVLSHFPKLIQRDPEIFQAVKKAEIYFDVFPKSWLTAELNMNISIEIIKL